ncbi:hypothetical protein QBC40DRAFT_16572 [Triangularia verruculosa]|uniref:BZIP domain-containing protein n=1 Tax=Triangularia verruculosa TaxID=2587418 RepID=A0AAN6XMR3_9PEZI|nr:hypothetical protein QBC40DRAFT_16572 [Triangularia verruculosa]
MDAPSHFLDQCLDEFDDTHAYQTPDHDVDGHALDLNAFHPYDSKLDFGPSPSRDEPPPDLDLGGPAYEWDVIPSVDTTMDPQGGHKLFVDPGLYQPDPDNEDIKAGIQVFTMDMSRPSTQRTSSSKSQSNRTSKSGSTSTDITLPEQDSTENADNRPHKKRKTRRIKKEANMEQDEHKRNKFLERNRIAASKCREKKKVYVSELEETKIGLENQHGSLQMEFNALLGEVSGLKHHLMAHAKCNDPNIDRWLNNEARRFVQVQTSSDLFAPGFTFGQPSTTGAGQPPILTPGSPRSRNPSIASNQYQLHGSMTGFEGLGGPGSIGGSSGPGSDRQGSIAYPPGTAALYASPTDTAFPSCLDDPTHGHHLGVKRESGINYDHMPDSMFSPQSLEEPSSTFGRGNHY